LSLWRRIILRIFRCDGGKNHQSSSRHVGTGPMTYRFQIAGYRNRSASRRSWRSRRFPVAGVRIPLCPPLLTRKCVPKISWSGRARSPPNCRCYCQGPLLYSPF
jgi:hypothetical protein